MTRAPGSNASAHRAAPVDQDHEPARPFDESRVPLPHVQEGDPHAAVHPPAHRRPGQAGTDHQRQRAALSRSRRLRAGRAAARSEQRPTRSRWSRASWAPHRDNGAHPGNRPASHSAKPPPASRPAERQQPSSGWNAPRALPSRPSGRTPSSSGGTSSRLPTATPAPARRSGGRTAGRVATKAATLTAAPRISQRPAAPRARTPAPRLRRQACVSGGQGDDAGKRQLERDVESSSGEVASSTSAARRRWRWPGRVAAQDHRPQGQPGHQRRARGGHRLPGEQRVEPQHRQAQRRCRSPPVRTRRAKPGNSAAARRTQEEQETGHRGEVQARHRQDVQRARGLEPFLRLRPPPRTVRPAPAPAGARSPARAPARRGRRQRQVGPVGQPTRRQAARPACSRCMGSPLTTVANRSTPEARAARPGSGKPGLARPPGSASRPLKRTRSPARKPPVRAARLTTSCPAFGLAVHAQQVGQRRARPDRSGPALEANHPEPPGAHERPRPASATACCRTGDRGRDPMALASQQAADTQRHQRAANHNASQTARPIPPASESPQVA